MSDQTQYKINDTTKWVMISLALMFDGIQYITPGYTDTLITAIAALVFGMILIEHGALTVKGSSALRYGRMLAVAGELIISHIPAITLTIIIQILISRAADRVVPDSVQGLLRTAKLKGKLQDVSKGKRFIKMRSKKMARVAYGKGKRGANTRARKMGIKPSAETTRRQQRLQNTKSTPKTVV